MTRVWIVRTLGIAIIGGILIFGSQAAQPLIPSLMPLGAGMLGDRIGRAEVAPVVRNCISNALGFGSDTDLEPSAAYSILKMGGWQTGIYAMLGISKSRSLRSEAESTLSMASNWGRLADCIYAQAGAQLCDSDNRAAAVEAMVRFMLYAKQTETLSAETAATVETPRDWRAIERFRRTIEPIKDRLLSMLKAHRRDGIVVASDFGFFPPAEISHIMREEKAFRDVCAG
jgi:hypothetical protein